MQNTGAGQAAGVPLRGGAFLVTPGSLTFRRYITNADRGRVPKPQELPSVRRARCSDATNAALSGSRQYKQNPKIAIDETSKRCGVGGCPSEASVVNAGGTARTGRRGGRISGEKWSKSRDGALFFEPAATVRERERESPGAMKGAACDYVGNSQACSPVPAAEKMTGYRLRRVAKIKMIDLRGCRSGCRAQRLASKYAGWRERRSKYA